MEVRHRRFFGADDRDALGKVLHGQRVTVDDHQHFPTMRSDSNRHFACRGEPSTIDHVSCQRMRDETTINDNDIVRLTSTHCKLACVVDGAPNRRAVTLTSKRNCRQRREFADSCDASEGISNYLSLQLTLRADCDMLPITTTAPIPDVATWWTDPSGRRIEHVDRSRVDAIFAHSVETSHHPLMRQRALHKYDPPIGFACERRTAGNDAIARKRQVIADLHAATYGDG